MHKKMPLLPDVFCVLFLSPELASFPEVAPNVAKFSVSTLFMDSRQICEERIDYMVLSVKATTVYGSGIYMHRSRD